MALVRNWSVFGGVVTKSALVPLARAQVRLATSERPRLVSPIRQPLRVTIWRNGRIELDAHRIGALCCRAPSLSAAVSVASLGALCARQPIKPVHVSSAIRHIAIRALSLLLHLLHSTSHPVAGPLTSRLAESPLDIISTHRVHFAAPPLARHTPRTPAPVLRQISLALTLAVSSHQTC